MCRGALHKVNMHKWIPGTARYEKLGEGDAVQDVSLEGFKQWKPEENSWGAEAELLRPPSRASLDFGTANSGK